jgi:L-rhamnose mutarotase
MIRFARTARLRPEKEAFWIEIHENTWPELLEILKRYHVQNYSIFLHDGCLFSYFEYTGDNLEKDLAEASTLETVQKWDKVSGECFEYKNPGDSSPWSVMKSVFFLE